MKNFKVLLLPAFVLLAGAGSAYATSAIKKDTGAVRSGYAYHFGEKPECINTRKECSTQGSVICTADVGMGPETLYDLNGTGCPNNLWEVQ